MSIKIGTAETIVEKKKKLKKRAGLSSGTGSGGGNRNRGGGNNGGGGNGGDNNKNQDYLGDTERYSSDKFRIGMWFLLLAVMMTFGGLIAAYILVATNSALEWKPFTRLPYPVWVSTFLLFASSITYTISQKYLRNDNQTKAKNFLLATTVLGAMFISSQILAWLELVREGVYMASNPYAGFFYTLTALHALHVVGGICALGYIVLRTRHETVLEEELTKRKLISNAVGWYWHFMDGLWIVLFLLLGFWK